MTDLRSQLIRDEGCVPYAYQDSLGYWTIGVGHLVDRRRGGSLPPHIVDALLDHDIATHDRELVAAFPFVDRLDAPRRATLVNMAFQLGVPGLKGFVRAMGHMERGAYEAAAQAFSESKVASEQTPERWRRHCAQIRTGEWQ